MQIDVLNNELEVLNKKQEELENAKTLFEENVDSFIKCLTNINSNIAKINEILDYSDDTLLSENIKESNGEMVTKVNNLVNDIDSKKTSVLLSLENKINDLKNEKHTINDKLTKLQNTGGDDNGNS